MLQWLIKEPVTVPDWREGNTLPGWVLSRRATCPALVHGALPGAGSVLAGAEPEAPLVARTLLGLGVVSRTMIPEEFLCVFWTNASLFQLPRVGFVVCN